MISVLRADFLRALHCPAVVILALTLGLRAKNMFTRRDAEPVPLRRSRSKCAAGNGAGVPRQPLPAADRRFLTKRSR